MSYYKVYERNSNHICSLYSSKEEGTLPESVFPDLIEKVWETKHAYNFWNGSRIEGIPFDYIKVMSAQQQRVDKMERATPQEISILEDFEASVIDISETHKIGFWGKLELK